MNISELAKPCILIADDDLDSFIQLKEALSQCYPESNIEWVKDGKELLDYLETKTAPSVILLDLFMPRVNGYEALAEMKRHDKFSQIPVIILTISARADEVLKAYKLSANTYMKKPKGLTDLKDFMDAFKIYWPQIADLSAETRE